MLVVRSPIWGQTLENEHGAIFSIHPNSLLQEISKNVDRDKSFLDCKIFLGWSRNYPGVEILDANRLIVESVAKQFEGKLLVFPGNPSVKYFDARGLEPYVVKGVFGLIHGKVVGVAMLELGNFLDALRGLGIEINRFSYTPGPLNVHSTFSSSDIIKTYNDVMDICQFHVDPELWRLNWLSSRRMKNLFSSSHIHKHN